MGRRRRVLWDDPNFVIDDLLPINSGQFTLGDAQHTYKAIYVDSVVSSVATSLTATGNAIGNAYQLTEAVNNFGTVAASTGAKLNDDTPVGGSTIVRNGGANALAVYPPDASGTINGGSAGASVSVAAGAIATFIKVAANTWIAYESAAA